MSFASAYSESEHPVFSFEVFPPKTEKARRNFDRIVPELVALEPEFVTVTYGAMGSTREKTIDIAASIKESYGLETACHLTCVGATRDELAAILDQIESAGVKNVVALRGDPPQGETAFVQVDGGYAHAAQLVAHIRERGGFGVAVAGYPEKHVEAPDLDTDLAFLKAKVDAGADAVVTQLFYDNSVYFSFVERARSLGITCPIVPGILPIVSAKQVRRITEMCGASIPQDLLAELDAAGEDADAAETIGVRRAVAQIDELLDRGAPGVHFYVLNRSRHMHRIFEEIKRDSPAS